MSSRTKLICRCLIPVIFGSALWIGCGRDAANDQTAPESAFRAFRGALSAGDQAAVWQFLGPETRGALEARADAFATAGLERPEPSSLLTAAWVPTEADIDTLERSEDEADHVTLRLTTYLGHESEVQMLRAEGGGWWVELALDAGALEGSGE